MGKVFLDVTMSPDGLLLGRTTTILAPGLSQNFIHSQRSISDLLNLENSLIFPCSCGESSRFHENLVHFFLISLRYSLIDSTIRAVTVVFISIAKCLKSSSRSVGIFIVVLVSSSSIISSFSIYTFSYTHSYIYICFGI